LDYVGQFFEELWVPIRNIPQFQAGVREQLAPWLTEEKYHKEGEALSYAIAEWYQSVYGPDALDTLFLWAREIYLFHGPDRIAEKEWNPIPYRCRDVAAEFRALEWVFELLTRVRQDQEEKTAAFEDKMIIGAPLSAWDARVLEVQYASQDGLETTIDLIVTYNIFLEAWEKHCSQLSFEELQSVFEVGKRVAEVQEMQDLEVVFPGSWRFELRKLLDLFTK
jgi:hypothetical protein